MMIPLPFFQPMDALPGLELNDLMEYLFTFFLCSIRLSAFLISSPFLGSRSIPLNVKIVFYIFFLFWLFIWYSTHRRNISKPCNNNYHRSTYWTRVWFNSYNLVFSCCFSWRENCVHNRLRFFPNDWSWNWGTNASN